MQQRCCYDLPARLTFQHHGQSTLSKASLYRPLADIFITSAETVPTCLLVSIYMYTIETRKFDLQLNIFTRDITIKCVISLKFDYVTLESLSQHCTQKYFLDFFSKYAKQCNCFPTNATTRRVEITFVCYVFKLR